MAESKEMHLAEQSDPRWVEHLADWLVSCWADNWAGSSAEQMAVVKAVVLAALKVAGTVEMSAVMSVGSTADLLVVAKAVRWAAWMADCSV